jgi:phenylacetate-CoA ligase
MSTFTNTLKQLTFGDAAFRRHPFYYFTARRRFQVLANKDTAARRDWTSRKLKKTLSAALHTRYGCHIQAGTDLASWPVLEKAIVQADPSSFRRGGAFLSTTASTGGTTGSPLTLSRTMQSVAVEQAAVDFLMNRLGVDMSTCRIAVLRADGIKDPSDNSPPFWKLSHGGWRLILSSHHLRPETIDDFADRLEQFKPDVLWVYPSPLETLCRLLMQVGRSLQIRTVLSSSEVLSRQAWQLATDALSTRDVLDYYGQAERVACAYASSFGEYRFLTGYANIELIPCNFEHDSTLHEIVGTSLWNSLMPLVRYRTGDLLSIPSSWNAAELEEVALGVRPFSGVIGRTGEFLFTPEGARVVGINHFPRDVEHVLRIQVIQETIDRVRILVLPAPGYSTQDAARLMDNAHAKLPKSMRVEIETTDALERTSGGKTPFVIHRPSACRDRRYDSA